MLLSDDQWFCVVIGLLFSLFFGWGWRLFGDWQRCWKFLFSVGLAAVVGGPVSTGLPAAAAACQSFLYDFYKKLTELSANNFRLLFCWPGWSLVTSLNSAVTSWCGSSGDKAASPHPRSRLTQLPLCFTRQKGSQSVSFYRSRAQ